MYLRRTGIDNFFEQAIGGTVAQSSFAIMSMSVYLNVNLLIFIWFLFWKF